MSTKVKAHVAARGWVTRVSKRLDSLLSQDSVDLTELQDAVMEFDNRIKTLDDLQSEVEIELKEDEMEDDIETAADFREKSRIPRVAAARKLSMCTSQGDADVASVASSASTTTEAKLPKLELPTFEGDSLKWISFWEQFEVIVDSSDMVDVTKFTYLRSLLKGEAKATIEGLSLSGQHYHVACELLKKRFGRPELIIFGHVQALLGIAVPKHAKVSILWNMYNDLQAHVRSLQALGISGEQYGVILTPLILSRLPPDMRFEWARDGEKHENDLIWLLEFLRKEIERKERSQTFTSCSLSPEEKKSSAHVSTAAALLSSSDELCAICGKAGHSTHRCYVLNKMSVSERREAFRNKGICFKCLSRHRDHKFRNCKSKCSKCYGWHNVLLCEKQSSDRKTEKINVTENDAEPNVKSVVNDNVISHTGVACASSSKTSVLMQTLRVQVKGLHSKVTAVVLFDTGSDKTYVSKRVIDKVNPEWITSESVSYSAFGSETSSQVETRNVYNVCLQGLNGTTQSVLATEIPVICSPLFCPAIPQIVLDSFGGSADVVDVCAGQEVKVDILIGLDNYWKLMTPEVIKLPQGLVAQRSVFGWVVSGAMPNSEQQVTPAVSHQLFCLTDFSDRAVQSFWDLESVGVSSVDIATVDPILKGFEDSITFTGQRYEVSLPWKSERVKHKLLNNEKIAKSRLDNLSRKLAKDPELAKRYHNVFTTYVDEGVIEEVPADEVQGDNPIYYMPHRPVVKETSLTTKVRPVFDASSKGANGVSLNDCLETGPSLIPNLPAILMRFRRWKVALSADITKAFLQIQVQCVDRDVHRFLWNDDGFVRVLRFRRVPFGNKSSPFLLNATIKHHLGKYPSTKVVEELSENLYVDDLLTGCDDDSEGCAMVHEASEVMAQANMILSKWSSNSAQIGEMLSHEFQDRSVGEDSSLKVLGLRWIASEDCFSFDGVEMPGDLCITKRVVLSFIARLFDPLGYLTPFVMTAKCMFQGLWQTGAGWDEVVPDIICKKFLTWIMGVKTIQRWKIPRTYTGGCWRDIKIIELHAFGDASQVAYGACVYLRVQLQTLEWRSSLVFAKGKVAPLKQITLPRLELLAAVLCGRLLVYVRDALCLPESVTYKCWTDSSIVLAWIQSDPCRWKPFVGNRVLVIHDLTDPSNWHHCPGKLNSADLITRGLSAEELIKSDLWLQGPAFLTEDPIHFVVSGETDLLVRLNTEAVDSAPTLLSMEHEPLIEIERWGSFVKAIRVMGWILRFKNNVCKSVDTPTTGELTLEELNTARVCLVKVVQQHFYCDEYKCLLSGQAVIRKSSVFKLSPFLDEEGIMRVQGRLQFSKLSYEEKHPIILPRGHLSLLIIRHYHVLLKHAGVNILLVRLRDQFWIIGARQICKRVIRECSSCRRQDAVGADQTMAPLPRFRVTQAPVFSVTGIDHCGPLYCVDLGKKKLYVLLFTCAVVRAVHLELVDSLSAEATLFAIRRFVARRGMPSLIMSDNAKGFKAAKDLIAKQFGTDGPMWKYIVPRGPWWGGWWERLVKSVKSPLKRTVGLKALTRVQLETLLFEIEACINSRPLTFVGDEVRSGSPLTPSHFLVGRPLNAAPVRIESDATIKAEDLILRKEVQDETLDKFWSCWLSEYLRNLPPCKRISVSDAGIQIGDVVLVKDVGCSRLQWPMGIIRQIFPGRDGLVRGVEVQTTKGLFTRPIQHIYDLELVKRSSEEVQSCQTESTNPSSSAEVNVNNVDKDVHAHRDDGIVRMSRYGRVLKYPSRFVNM